MFEFEHISRLFDEDDPAAFFDFFGQNPSEQDPSEFEFPEGPSELMVKVRANDCDDVLVGFPYLQDQYLDGHEEEEGDEQDCIWLRIVLADRADTTVAQEEFLNTNPLVVEYLIR